MEFSYHEECWPNTYHGKYMFSLHITLCRDLLVIILAYQTYLEVLAGYKYPNLGSIDFIVESIKR